MKFRSIYSQQYCAKNCTGFSTSAAGGCFRSYLLTVFIRSRSTTSSRTYRAFYPNKGARDGGAIIKTNIPFRAGLLFDVPDGAASRLSPREKRKNARARSRRVRRYMQILDRGRSCCQQGCTALHWFSLLQPALVALKRIHTVHCRRP